MVLPGKEESIGEDRDELDIESAVADENIDPAVFGIRNALEQPDARVYTTLELHSKLSALRGDDAKVVDGHTYSPNPQRENRPQPAIPTRCAIVDLWLRFHLQEGKTLSGLQENRWKSSIPSFTIFMFLPSSLPSCKMRMAKKSASAWMGNNV